MIVSGPPRVCRNPPGPAQGGPQAPAPVLLNAIPSAKKPKKRTPGNPPERSKQVKTQAKSLLRFRRKRLNRSTKSVSIAAACPPVAISAVIDRSRSVVGVILQQAPIGTNGPFAPTPTARHTSPNTPRFRSERTVHSAYRHERSVRPNPNDTRAPRKSAAPSHRCAANPERTARSLRLSARMVRSLHSGGAQRGGGGPFRCGASKSPPHRGGGVRRASPGYAERSRPQTPGRGVR